MNEILEVNNLEKSFKAKKVLYNVSFKCKQGKIAGLIGANGAGKTTIMKAILGLIKYSGEIKIENKVISFNGPYSGNVGSLIEYPSLYPFLTGRENLKLFALNGEKEELNELISELKMEEFIDKKVKSYSLGTKQKLGIALALINSPKLVILDEPMNGLDPQSTRDLRNIILKRARQGTTFLISSHILAELQKIIDDVIVINKGNVVSCSSMEELIKKNPRKIILKTSNDNDAKEKLKQMGYKLTTNTQIEVILNENENIELAIEQLSNEKIFVKDIIHEENLENTLLSLMERGR